MSRLRIVVLVASILTISSVSSIHPMNYFNQCATYMPLLKVAQYSWPVLRGTGSFMINNRSLITSAAPGILALGTGVVLMAREWSVARQLRQLGSRIGNLASNMGAEFTKVKDMITGVKSDVQSLHGVVSSMHKKVDEIKDDIGAAGQGVARVEFGIAQLDGQVATIQSAMAAHDAQQKQTQKDVVAVKDAQMLHREENRVQFSSLFDRCTDMTRLAEVRFQEQSRLSQDLDKRIHELRAAFKDDIHQAGSVLESRLANVESMVSQILVVLRQSKQASPVLSLTSSLTSFTECSSQEPEITNRLRETAMRLSKELSFNKSSTMAELRTLESGTSFVALPTYAASLSLTNPRALTLSRHN